MKYQNAHQGSFGIEFLSSNSNHWTRFSLHLFKNTKKKKKKPQPTKTYQFFS